MTFKEIYRELAFALGWDPEMCRSAVEQLELELESETLIPNPKVRGMIEAAREAGKRVVFVSDMYLPADFIRGQLKRFGLTRDGDHYYVSSEHKATKSSGRLFEVVLKEEQVQPRAVTHVGDHAHSDDAVPRRMGIINPSVPRRPPEPIRGGDGVICRRNRWPIRGFCRGGPGRPFVRAFVTRAGRGTLGGWNGGRRTDLVGVCFVGSGAGPAGGA